MSTITTMEMALDQIDNERAVLAKSLELTVIHKLTRIEQVAVVLRKHDEMRDAVAALVEVAGRTIPFLRDEAAKYEDDGSNEPLEIARDLEALLKHAGGVE
ncbi:hypothetical protein SAMN04487785_102419 [Dyella jiangningensis]|uniref:hypothetical protein n=1 Tax=Dyella sp. AtDHG13 TaxID=1938897 RepID=UPI0008912A97|nr:hypothetical protein [Dyella sp. AtDHG13]PXV60691.1 hypothetical protein BDW41_102418 [Dyella sp. AtDHG13]SDJ55311.1 hypothetical protein SAMN04487785_102419 [Dyella jiangningensis]